MSTLGEHQGNGIRFDMHLSAPNGGVAQMLCRPEGQWVTWNEYEKLKADFYQASDERADYAKDVSKLKADVERLTALVESNLNSSKVAIGKADAVLHERDSLKAEVNRLIEERCFLNEKLNHFVKQTVQNREQVQRLRKAGDAVIVALDKRDDCFDNSDKRQAIADWNAAKEGKQS